MSFNPIFKTLNESQLFKIAMQSLTSSFPSAVAVAAAVGYLSCPEVLLSMPGGSSSLLSFVTGSTCLTGSLRFNRAGQSILSSLAPQEGHRGNCNRLVRKCHRFVGTKMAAERYEQDHGDQVDEESDEGSAERSNWRSSTSPLLFKFGIVADIQYADVNDGRGFSGRARYYRNSLVSLAKTVNTWNRVGAEFGVHLGDIIDGCCPRDLSDGALQEVTAILDLWPRRMHHLVGNHCLYNHSRETLTTRLGMASPEESCAYYDYTHKGVRFVALDGYDISVDGWPPGHPKRKAAQKILDKHNPNENQNDPSGLDGLSRRFVRFNGAVGSRQMAWLEEVLADARGAGQKVIVFSHEPVHPRVSNPVCLLWNYAEVLNLLNEHSDVVVACFAGHAHQGGYVYDKRIHHRVVEAMVEAAPDMGGTHAVVEVYSDRLVLNGDGAVRSSVLPFDRISPTPWS
ncbi:unnamed protein product [Discosporangium mesarthrocarpum]